MLKKRTILSFYQCASCRTLAIELVRQNANSTYLSKQSGHKEPSWAERYSGSRPDMKYFERQKLTYVDYKCSPTVPYVSCLYYYDALILGSITIAYMTMHDIVFSINIAGGDVVV